MSVQSRKRLRNQSVRRARASPGSPASERDQSRGTPDVSRIEEGIGTAVDVLRDRGIQDIRLTESEALAMGYHRVGGSEELEYILCLREEAETSRAAYDALCHIAAYAVHLDPETPDHLCWLASDLMRGEIGKPPGKPRGTNASRDLAIRAAVARLRDDFEKLGRAPEPAGPDCCVEGGSCLDMAGLAHEALTGVPLTYTNVKRIWYLKSPLSSGIWQVFGGRYEWLHGLVDGLEDLGWNDGLADVIFDARHC